MSDSTPPPPGRAPGDPGAAPPHAIGLGSSPGGGFVPWHRQSGAWVAIGAVVVVFAAAFVILLTRLPAAPQAGASAAASPEAASPFASASPEPAPAAPAAPAPTAECPAPSGAATAEAGQPAGATADFGIMLGCDGVPGGPQAEAQVRVDVVSDYICPYCKRFDEQVGAQLDQALKDGQITLVLHPLGYLDGFSTTEYSSRAARAATAVASLDPDHFGAFDQALWDNQPAEGG
ncbi:MAG: DsbA family protein, partial [Bifidobacteriaceae bacterium]|nr:DsbA family protein [Bifidobacteriaceae bacterium]